MLQSEVNLLRCHWSQAGLRCTQVCLSGLSSPTHTRSLTIHPSPTSSRPDTTHTHARMHARIHGCTDACTHTHSHTHACMHTHTHPHTPSTFYPSRLVANQIQRVSALHFTHTHTLFLSRSLSRSLSLSLSTFYPSRLAGEPNSALIFTHFLRTSSFLQAKEPARFSAQLRQTSLSLSLDPN